MAIFKSVEQTAKDGTAGLEVQKLGGRVRFGVAKVATTVAMTTGDTIEMMEIPRNAILKSLNLYHAAVTGATDVNVGDTNDVDGLIDGANISSAGLKHIGNGDGGDGGTNGWSGVLDAEKQLWEVLGYASESAAPAAITIQLDFDSDPSVAVDIVMTAEWIID